MLNVKDITPKEIKIIPAKDKLEVVDPSQDIGAVVGGLGGRLASTIKKAINAEGNLVKDVINARLDTSAKTILGSFTFGVSGAITIQTDADNGLWISPTGILAKKLGVNTLTVTNEGDVTMAGTITASAGSIGGWTISVAALYYDGATDNVSAGMASADYPFYAGKKYADRATASFRVTPAGVVYATGAIIDGTSTIGGRLVSTVADAINAVGNFIDANLDTSAKTILGDFTFGESGAIKMITDANNGLWLSPTGILGKKAGENTFAIGIDGTATFAGTLSGASGTFGTITAGTITGVDVFASQFRNLRWTVQYGLNTTTGWETVTSGGATLTPYASNLMLLLALDALGAAATASIEVGSFGIDLTTSSTNPLTLSKSPMLEAAAVFTVLSGDGVGYLRMGQIDDSTSAYIGFAFSSGATSGAYHDGSNGFGVELTNAIDNTKWHKYRIQVTPNGSNYDVKWYVDDVLEATVSNHDFTGTSGKNFGVRVSNNWAAGGAEDSAVMVVGSVIFQQDY